MRIRNLTKFHINGLNQEKILNELSKHFQLSEIDRQDKNNTLFMCSYFDSKKIEKFLKKSNIKIVSIQYDGPVYKIKNIFSSWGMICALVLFFLFFLIQYQFILQFDIQGLVRVSKSEIVEYVNKNFSRNKFDLDTKLVEIGLIENFSRISFASCIIKGQTLVINIKEKLMPEEMYGQFKPLVAKSDARINNINLISGTLKVKVGDFVQKGDVLVEPFTIDTSGNIKKVEAKAEILADIYYESSVSHSEHFIEVTRTGNVVEQNDIYLFGLKIYSFKQDIPFKMYEVEKENVKLTNNLFLPFKMQKIKIYELVENIIETTFYEVKDEYIEKARQKALENIENCDKIKEEFYNLRHQVGVTILDYCIITEENVGEYYDC